MARLRDREGRRTRLGAGAGPAGLTTRLRARREGLKRPFPAQAGARDRADAARARSALPRAARPAKPSAPSPGRRAADVAADRARAAEAAAKALQSYAPPLRGPLSALARMSPRHADLLTSFPAAAVAIATERGGPAERGEALWLIKQGAPLRAIAAALDLPLWMRRLPADMFAGPLPVDLGDTDDDAFGRALLPLAPATPITRRLWLPRVIAARRRADDAVALWVARVTPSDARRRAGGRPGGAPQAGEPAYLAVLFEALYHHPRDRIAATRSEDQALALIALYAWTSRHGDGVAAEAIAKPWSARLSLRRAALETALWWRGLLSACRRASAARLDPAAEDWRAPHAVGRYEIQAIRDIPTLRAEARAMRNCLRQYETRMLDGDALLFAVRRGGRSVATLQLGLPVRSPERPTIAQLKGVANSAPSRAAKAAVAAWLEARPPFPWRVLCGNAAHVVDLRRWRAAWRPYRLAKPDASLLPPTPLGGSSLLSAVDRVAFRHEAG